MQKWFSDLEFVVARSAKRRSGFVRTAIVDSAIAVRLAEQKRGAGNGVMPTAVTNGLGRVGSIIATDNVHTDNVTRRLA